MERVGLAGSAKVVDRGKRMELVRAQSFFIGEQAKLAFMYFDHQGVLAATN